MDIMKQILLLFFIFFTGIAHAQYKYQDRSLSAQERAEDLVSRLTMREKVSLMSDGSRAIPRVGIKPYNWWNEALHGVGRAGLATVFPQPIGMAATFDPDLIFNIFEAVSDEARAKHTQSVSQGNYSRYQGLTMWTPTVNILRDPRWGRGIETYGEDPYLSSLMGVAVVKGLQGPEDSKYNKLHACAKHFAVHSGPEWNRHSFNAENITPRDLYETYLPPFEALVKEAKVKEVMCAYNRFEGEPCCSNKRLLTQILRNDWGYKGIVVSDCGAIADFFNDRGHKTHPDKASAAADAVITGTDLDCGGSYSGLIEGMEKGLIKEDEVDVSVTRLMKARFELGEMDPPAEVSWTKIPYSVVASDTHDALALEAARKSITLLINKGNFLPLKRNKGLTIAVMGPNANDSVMQWGNYNGTPPHTITILNGIKNALGKNDHLIYEKGCDHVEHTLMESAFNDCSINNTPGFHARYWNSKKRNGEPVASNFISTPFRFCTSGATVFAPNVNLTDFSATYNSTFTPKKSGMAILDFYYCGKVTLSINGTPAKEYRTNHGSRKASYKMKVQAGESYDIQIDFEYSMPDAQLNFDLGFKEEINIGQSISKVKDADIVIFAGGISPSLEGEEMGVNLPGFKRGDRTEIELPTVQRELIQALRNSGKKVVFINCSGSSIAMSPEIENCEAILQAWYPGQSGGKAIAEVLFGDYNPSGKLPVTFYKSISQLPDFEDYNMTGRTYRYISQEPLFPFGYGMSYTTFQYGKPELDKQEVKTEEAAITLKVPITNTGKIKGDEVVQVYLKRLNDSKGPNKTLRAFKRVNIPAGETMIVTLKLSNKQLEWWDNASNTMRVFPGKFEIMVGSSSQDKDLQKLSFILK